MNKILLVVTLISVFLLAGCNNDEGKKIIQPEVTDNQQEEVSGDIFSGPPADYVLSEEDNENIAQIKKLGLNDDIATRCMWILKNSGCNKIVEIKEDENQPDSYYPTMYIIVDEMGKSYRIERIDNSVVSSIYDLQTNSYIMAIVQ